MPIDYRIDKEKKIVHASVHGEFTIQDIIHAIESIVNDPDFHAGFDVLSDHTRVTRSISTDQVINTAAYVGNLADRLKNSHWAAIAGSEVSFGMLRMLSSHLDQAPFTLRVFRTSREAEEWLAESKQSRT